MNHHILEQCLSFIQVALIDITLAGDNAIVIGMAVTGLPPRQKQTAITAGIGAAALCRILLAVIAVKLLEIPGLPLLGGLMLFWVCWRMFVELRRPGPSALDRGDAPLPPAKTMRQAITTVIIADLSMSLDNVIAVAGAAQEHIYVLIAGLALSVLLMIVSASLIARLMEKYRWIGWVGLFIITLVAGRLVYHGYFQLLPLVTGA